MQQEIIPPVERELILDELTKERFLRHTNKGGNQLYIVNYHNSPNILREIGRLREEAFRTAGGGTGKDMDIDEYDTSEYPYEQLIVWDPEEKEILAGYRLLKCTDAEKDENGRVVTATAHLFDLSDRFYDEYLPYTIELGRSFVQPKYQRGASRKGIFSLDNLWDGLGAIIELNPAMKYLFGKVTMYPSFHREARNIILAFMNYYFPDKEGLVSPIESLVTPEELKPYQEFFSGLDYKEGHALLNKSVRERGENIPPLINSYMNLSDTMKTFGTAANYEFGEVEETGILVSINDIYPSRKERHIESFKDNKEFTGALFKKGK